VAIPNMLLGYIAYMTPRSPFPPFYKKFLFCLSHEDMKSIHHILLLTPPSFALLPPRSSPPLPRHPATHTHACTHTFTHTHIHSSIYCHFFPNSFLCGCVKRFLLLFPLLVSFHLVPSTPSFLSLSLFSSHPCIIQ
jgi:hypothetical protein